MKQASFFLIAIIFCSITTRAQNWVNGGNSLTADGTLGTKSNFSLLFQTNNTERGRVTNNGLWGFGTTKPHAKVHINSTAAKDPLNVQVNGATKLLVHSGGGVAVGASVTPPANGLYVSGNAGIGTATPQNTLHVFKGSSGVIGYYDAPLLVENSMHSYVNILAPDANETGVLFGRPNSGLPGGNVDGGIIYNSAATLKGLQFRTNGNIVQMVLTDKGKLGVGTAFPGDSRLRLTLDNSENGLSLERPSTGGKWDITPGVITGDLFLVSHDVTVGRFNGITGAYAALSDERQKINIKPMSDALENIRRLKPSVYQFKNAKDTVKHNGFIAQEVMKLFPSIVSHHVQPAQNIDVYLMDYSQFGVLAIKGIQELMTVIDDQEKRTAAMQNGYTAKIDQLEKRVGELEMLLKKMIDMKDKNVVAFSNTSLEQNTPNPFRNNTTVRYKLPVDSNGEIVVYNRQGAVVKTITANGNGQSVIDAKNMTPGTYTYSLLINGRPAGSKQMLVVR
ncbi:MAG TPA: tail fiber domain-containing protein [Parafilimonas sp.]|nr:tail fiber domain-containing protein [Parafilimonas sp.]